MALNCLASGRPLPHVSLTLRWYGDGRASHEPLRSPCPVACGEPAVPLWRLAAWPGRHVSALTLLCVA